MGLLSIFKKNTPVLLRLPSGSFTVDREGKILIGTIPSTFPTNVLRDIATQVQTAFREAASAQLPLSMLTINYPSLQITAREMRGGAMIFLTPKAPYSLLSEN